MLRGKGNRSGYDEIVHIIVGGFAIDIDLV